MILQHIRALRSHNISYRVSSNIACEQPLQWRGRVYSKNDETERHGYREIKKKKHGDNIVLKQLNYFVPSGRAEVFYLQKETMQEDPTV